MAMEQEYWKRSAGPKWAADQVRMDRLLSPYADALETAARIPDGATLVDVGCGCGATTLMAQRVSPGARVIGLDVSEPMLEVAERRAQGEPAGVARPRFVCGDAATEPLEPGCVTRIISRFGVMFFGDPAAAFAHMRGWLATDGRMVVVVWGEPADNPWLTAPVQAIARHVAVPAADPTAPGPMSLGSAARRRQVFGAAGLTMAAEDHIDSPFRVEGSVPEVADFYLGRGPVAAALEAASESDRQAAVTALREYVAAKHDGSGVSLPAHAVRVTLAP